MFVETPAWGSLSCVRRVLQCSELKLHVKKVSYIQFVVCLQIHARAGDIMSSKLFLMHPASLHFASCFIQISHSLYRQRVGVFVNKALASSTKPLINEYQSKVFLNKCNIKKLSFLRWNIIFVTIASIDGPNLRLK